MNDEHLLPILSARSVALAVPAFVTLDGFDLGVGILPGPEREPQDRDVMVATVAPVREATRRGWS